MFDINFVYAQTNQNVYKLTDVRPFDLISIASFKTVMKS